MNADGRVVLGRVSGAHGVRGDVRVRYFGDGPENLLSFPELWLGRGREDPAPRCYSVLATGAARPGEVRLHLEGVSDREAAAALQGLWILGEREQLPELAEGEFYWHDLVGCQVQDGEGRALGTVREIWASGGHDLLVVDAPDGAQHLIPTAREFTREIDLEGRRIVVELIPGLLDF